MGRKNRYPRGGNAAVGDLFGGSAALAQVQAKVKDQQAVLDRAILRNLKMSRADVAAWQKVSHEIDVYLQDDTAHMYAQPQIDAGNQWLEDMQPWFEKVKASGTDITAPPLPPKTPGPGGALGSMEGILKWGLLFYVLVETGVLKRLRPKK